MNIQRLYRAMVHAVTRKIQLPHIADYTMPSAWNRCHHNYERHNIDGASVKRMGLGAQLSNIDFMSTLSSHDQEKPGVSSGAHTSARGSKRYRVKISCFLNQDMATGAIYHDRSLGLLKTDHLFLVFFGLPVHLVALTGMAVVDVLGWVYALSLAIKHYFTGQFCKVRISANQCFLRVASLFAKPLQLLGLLSSNVYGLYDPEYAMKCYASLERGAYKGALLASHFQPLLVKDPKDQYAAKQPGKMTPDFSNADDEAWIAFLGANNNHVNVSVCQQ